ncbi:MAG TPA: hypothetical protein VEN47_05910 [Myxococcota bacterium]|nr:hypothetical protein [Myxococcota bacterium]
MDFCLGRGFFGRDVCARGWCEFYSQQATEEELAQLGSLLRVPLREIVETQR